MATRAHPDRQMPEVLYDLRHRWYHRPFLASFSSAHWPRDYDISGTCLLPEVYTMACTILACTRRHEAYTLALHIARQQGLYLSDVTESPTGGSPHGHMPHSTPPTETISRLSGQGYGSGAPH